MKLRLRKPRRRTSPAPVDGDKIRKPLLMDRFLAILVGVTVGSLFSGLETSIVGSRVRPFDFLIAIIGVIILGQYPSQAIKAMGAFWAVFVSFFGIYVIRGLSGLIAVDAKVGIVEFLPGMEFIILAIAVGCATRLPQLRRDFLVTFLVVIALIGLYGFGAHVASGEPLKSLKTLNEPKYTYGLFAVFLISIWLSRLYRFRMWIFIPILAISAGILLISRERSAWLGVMVVGAYFFKRDFVRLGSRKSQQVLLSLCAAFVVVVVVTSVVAQHNEYVAAQFTNLVEPLELIDLKTGDIYYQLAESPSNKSRLFQLAMVKDIFHKHPWFGIGSDCYIFYAWPIAMGSGLSPLLINRVHGYYWLLLAENGIFALMLCLIMLISIYFQARFLLKRGPEVIKPVVLVALATGIYGVVSIAFIAGGSVALVFFMLPFGLLIGAWMEWRGAARLRSVNPDRQFYKQTN